MYIYISTNCFILPSGIWVKFYHNTVSLVTYLCHVIIKGQQWHFYCHFQHGILQMASTEFFSVSVIVLQQWYQVLDPLSPLNNMSHCLAIQKEIGTQLGSESTDSKTDLNIRGNLIHIFRSCYHFCALLTQKNEKLKTELIWSVAATRQTSLVRGQQSCWGHSGTLLRTRSPMGHQDRKELHRVYLAWGPLWSMNTKKLTSSFETQRQENILKYTVHSLQLPPVITHMTFSYIYTKSW